MTHSFNPDQRFLSLGFQGDPGSLNVQAPLNPNLAPPGYYMLFLLNSQGVPSIAQMVRLAPTPDTTVPAAPTDLAATGVHNAVSLDWDDNAEPDLDSYNVYRSTTTGLGFSQIATAVPSSAYTDSTAISGTTYFYVVAAVDTSNNQSANSNEASATPSLSSLASTSISGVGSSWQTVTLSDAYNSMVVVCSPNYGPSDLPAVPRVQNATGNTFQVRVQNPSGVPLSGYSVHCLALEQGVYTLAADGVMMEAVRFNSTLTDNQASWLGEPSAYSNSYTNPVVLGQVMTANDPAWSSFWASDGTPGNPPSPSALFVGKHVGEDPLTTRSNETLGYLVIEAGSGSIDGIPYSAALGPDIVKGFDDNPPSLTGLSSTVVAVVSSAGVNGWNGGLPILFGANPVNATSLNLAVDEGQIADSERLHTTEPLAYIVFDVVS